MASSSKSINTGGGNEIGVFYQSTTLSYIHWDVNQFKNSYVNNLYMNFMKLNPPRKVVISLLLLSFYQPILVLMGLVKMDTFLGVLKIEGLDDTTLRE